jgi:hypothetical protein
VVLGNVAINFAFGFKIGALEDGYVKSFRRGKPYLLRERVCSWSKQSTLRTRDRQLIIG